MAGKRKNYIGSCPMAESCKWRFEDENYYGCRYSIVNHEKNGRVGSNCPHFEPICAGSKRLSISKLFPGDKHG
jgi:hypothetical protein